MRKVTFGGANSFDNYFARKDDSVDWLMWTGEVASIMAEFWKSIDTIVMGRRTYEVALRMGVGGGAYPGRKNYVFSRTMKQNPGKKVKNLEFISEDAAEFVRKLKGQEGKGIYSTEAARKELLVRAVSCAFEWIVLSFLRTAHRFFSSAGERQPLLHRNTVKPLL